MECGRIGLLSDSISNTTSYSRVNTSESECQQRVTKTVKSRMRLWITRKQPWKLQKVLTADKVSIHCLAVVGWGGDPWSRKLGKNSFTAKSLSYLRRVWCLTCLLDLSPDAFISCRLFIVYLKSYFTDIKHFYFYFKEGEWIPQTYQTLRHVWFLSWLILRVILSEQRIFLNDKRTYFSLKMWVVHDNLPCCI